MSDPTSNNTPQAGEKKPDPAIITPPPSGEGDVGQSQASDEAIQADILPPESTPAGQAPSYGDTRFSTTQGPETATGSGGSGGGTGTGGPQTDPGLGAGPGYEPENPIGNPWTRLIYMLGYGVIAWIVFWLTLFLAILQFIVAVVNKELNEDLKGFSSRLVAYMGGLLNYVTYQSDEKPFPFGPFPKADVDNS